MQPCERGRIVRSISGHDEGMYYMVIGEQGGRVLLTDGHLKKQEVPKKKNRKHLEETETVLFAGRLEEGGRVTDEEIRHALKEYRKQLKN